MACSSRRWWRVSSHIRAPASGDDDAFVVGTLGAVAEIQATASGSSMVAPNISKINARTRVTDRTRFTPRTETQGRVKARGRRRAGEPGRISSAARPTPDRAAISFMHSQKKPSPTWNSFSTLGTRRLFTTNTMAWSSGWITVS